MYIAVKGGEQAIEASRRLLDDDRRGDPAVPPLRVDQVREQLGLLVDRVMAEASLFDPELAALAIRQACGDPVEAAFLLRAYRTTLPRFGYSLPVDTERMRVRRRVSAIFKDLPGGQVLGPTFDYTQRLLDFSVLRGDAGAAADADARRHAGAGAHAEAARHAGAGACGEAAAADVDAVDVDAWARAHAGTGPDAGGLVLPGALSTLMREGLVEPCAPGAGDPVPPDITRDPPLYPLPRSGWLQMLARADEGWVLGMGYSTQRGYAHTHPFGGDIRFGAVSVEVTPDELDFPIEIGEIELTECQMINQFVGSASVPPTFTLGYGLVFGQGERKAMAMSLVDRALRVAEFDELAASPAQQQEFVLPQGDSVEASGFVQHLKLPHYVTFESELQLVRKLRAEVQAAAAAASACPSAGRADAGSPAGGPAADRAGQGRHERDETETLIAGGQR